MEFCPKCDKLLQAVEEDSGTIMVCTACGFRKNAEDSLLTTIYEAKKLPEGETDIFVNEGRKDILPETNADCPECKNTTAYYWIEQTRAADEAPTRFYKCTKCAYTWREYS